MSTAVPNVVLRWIRIVPILMLFLQAEPPVAAGALTTRWADTITATNILPEYPRPHMMRDEWINLNGEWDYAISRTSNAAPATFAGRIRVPFPVESHLSGVGKTLDEHSTLWYRRTFTVPNSWRNRRVRLHFGAVDWSARVVLNGHVLGIHEGGYDSFSFDITSALRPAGENMLLVAVQDPTEGDQPRGKQSRKPEGIFYTATSGIWQTVWLEPVPEAEIQRIRFVPDLAKSSVSVLVLANTLAEDLRVEIEATSDGEPAGRIVAVPGAAAAMPLKVLRPWSPDQPHLYAAEVTLRRGDTVLDRVRSYFGMREIKVDTDADGFLRIFLNGAPLFQMGVLDQGFWPDGLYTAPSDEALRFDLETSKRLGFNLVRKHVKVEPERWYYWADKLGMLVWQDMPSGNNATDAGRRQFEVELQRILTQRSHHPSIVTWVLFNEGWGQFDTERLARRIKVADPTRLVNSASGWTDLKAGDVIDLHSYPNPLAPVAEPVRAGVLGEFGGIGLGITNHMWSLQKPWGYQLVPDSKELTQRYVTLLYKLWDLQKSNGLAAAVYTQLTDVETECNGFLTYDRAVLKVDPRDIRRANQPAPMLMPNAREGLFNWAYTTEAPPPNWMQPEFDSTAWLNGPGGFGTREGPNTLVNTSWATSNIWLRRAFVLPEGFAGAPTLSIYHDEDAEVYLNGELAFTATGYSTDYQEFPLAEQAVKALRSGRNVIAVHCRQTGGGQFIDAGLLTPLGGGTQ